ncbi:hypothetical protein Bbelb_240990 [Branchiostoma belcheri]|nr:hypothetical protein Bbelb_240990 [Branchiostoma belcheri]
MSLAASSPLSLAFMAIDKPGNTKIVQPYAHGGVTTLRLGHCRLAEGALGTSYDYARKVCIDDGGSLAMPKTRELDVALRNLVKTVGQNQDYWIGMKDVETLHGQKARWQWEDGSDLGNYQPEG